MTCSHKQHHVVPIKYRREVTEDDYGELLDSFEWALRGACASTPEQTHRAQEAAKRLSDLLVDEMLCTQWVDPCLIPAP